MAIVSEDSPVLTKTKELCELIVKDAEYNTLIGTIETFLSNDEARLLYQNVAQKSDELRSKQQAGVELGESEIEAFKDLRGQMEGNSVVMEFLDAQDELKLVQKSISEYVGMSIELGRVATEEDLAQLQGGCCGGGGCGDGGCGDGSCDSGSCG